MLITHLAMRDAQRRAKNRANMTTVHVLLRIAIASELVPCSSFFFFFIMIQFAKSGVLLSTPHTAWYVLNGANDSMTDKL